MQWGNPYTFLGNEDDGGLMDFGARFYDPRIGRFLSPDPIRQMGSSQTVNPYVYCSNNPLKYTDKFGLRPMPDKGMGTGMETSGYSSSGGGSLRGMSRGHQEVSEDRIALITTPETLTEKPGYLQAFLAYVEGVFGDTYENVIKDLFVVTGENDLARIEKQHADTYNVVAWFQHAAMNTEEGTGIGVAEMFGGPGRSFEVGLNRLLNFTDTIMVPPGEGRRYAFYNICDITDSHREIAANRLQCPVFTSSDKPKMSFNVVRGAMRGDFVAHTKYENVRPLGGSAPPVLELLHRLYPGLPPIDQNIEEIKIDPWWERDKTP